MKVTVPSLAKLNLDLRVLGKRPDGFHELRTVFQTIGLQDELEIEFEPAKRTEIELVSSIDIADNLVLRSARSILDHLKVKAHIRFSLRKRIPMGAGLGGGSSNAAAVLIAVPALAGRPTKFGELVHLGQELGSDVPFFLRGGTVFGFGRGAELYPGPEIPHYPVVVVSTGIHVSTPAAYRALGRETTGPLTWQSESPILREFQTIAWNLSENSLQQLPLKNDFEGVVFEQHPELVRVVRKLKRLGAKPALMTGSGSAIFGIFEDMQRASAAASGFPPGSASPARFVSRRQYRSVWRRALGSAFDASCLA